MSDSLIATVTIVSVGLIFLGFAVAAVITFKGMKAAKKLETPERFELLRQPGETLWKATERQFEEVINLLLGGTFAAAIVPMAPVMVLRFMPSANPWLLLFSSAALFLAVSAAVVTRSALLLDRRSNYWLGYLGERFVGEQLQPLRAHGYLIYHDVPTPFGGKENLDHVVVGPRGVAVIETKTRGKPTDGESGIVEVKFDGETITWPRYANDTGPVKQVARCAQRMRRFIQDKCGITVPVHQVIAIPGWRVKETAIVTPRVVSGRGVSAAVMERAQTAGEPLSPAQIRKIGDGIEHLCRDVVG